MPQKRTVYDRDWPEGKRPPGIVDAMAEDLADFEASGPSIHDYQLGQEEWPGDADIADEEKRKAGLVPDPDPTQPVN
jgi:hypothetical protein